MIRVLQKFQRFMLLLKCLELKFQKESDVPELLEDKNAPEIPKVMTDEVKAAESELLKVSEVTTSED